MFNIVFAALAVVLLVIWERRERRRGAVRDLFCPWGLLDVLLALAALIVLLGIAGTTAKALLPDESHPWRGAAATGIAGVVTCVFLLYHLRRRYGLLPRDVGLRFDTWGRDALLAGGLVLLVIAVESALAPVFVHLYEAEGEPVRLQHLVTQMQAGQSPTVLIVLIAFAVLVAPFWEEFLFRGVLQPFLGRHVGATLSILIPGVLFALIHYEEGSRFFREPILVFPLALALGYAYHRTQRLAAPLMLHMLHNSVTVLAVLAERPAG